jgi:hypothetical protein
LAKWGAALQWDQHGGFRALSQLVPRSFAGGGNGYDGMVDDFAMDSALSPSEISAIAAGDSPLNARKLNPRVATEPRRDERM